MDDQFLPDPGGLSDYMLKRLTRFPNSHNTAPLTYFPQRHIISCYKGDDVLSAISLFKTSASLMVYISERENDGASLDATDDPTLIYLNVFNQCNGSVVPDTRRRNRLLNSALIHSLEEVVNDLRCLEIENPGCGSISRLAVLSPDQQISIIQGLTPAFELWRKLCLVRNTVQHRHFVQMQSRNQDALVIPGYRIYINNEILFFVNMTGEKIITILNFEQFLMLVDSLSCRVMCRLACMINDFTSVEDLPSDALICRVYQWGDRLISESHMNAYAVLGEYESILTNSFVNFPGYDPLELGVDFNNFLSETADEIFEEYNVPADWLHQIQSILAEVTSPNVLSELFGLYKHWGNPMVDASASGRAVQEKIKERFPLDPAALVNLVASFNRMVTIEFIRINGKWPECRFDRTASGTPLYKAWSSKSIKVNEKDAEHRHAHWSLMKFGCNCVLDDYFDQASYLNDKSVSVYREHLDTLYMRALHPPAKALGDKYPEERRLLLEFLRREHLPIHDIFKIVMSGEVPKSWLCNAASMKGTEMKHMKARIFAVLPYELRQYFAVSEDAIKEHIFKYNPHQTMTMKEGDLVAKLKTVTEQLCIQGSGRELNVIHIVDFSKWNLRMRYENTCGVFKSIDDFMGTPGLIEASHPIFQGMLNVVQDPFNPPGCSVEEAETDTIWRDHDCGWEGQRQKGWTAVTSSVLSYLELLTGISSVICGQGDNQVLLTKFPVPENFSSAQDWVERDPIGAKTVLDTYYKTLSSECMKIGLKVKNAETCRSLSYLNYGKRLFFNGVELSMSLKRISKMMTEPNDAFPSTEAKMKTQEGSIYAAGLYSHPGILHYLISRVGTYISLSEAYNSNPLVIDKSEVLKKLSPDGLSSRFFSNLMKIPSTLGGPPQLSLPAYLGRGHPDPLCTDLVMVVFRARNGDQFSQQLLRCVQCSIWYNEDVNNLESLVHAPYSLNLKTPASASKPLEKLVGEAVSSFCKNPDIKELFCSSVDEMGKDILKALVSMVPIHPLIANDLFGRSLPGRKKAFLSGFTNATSMSRLVMESVHQPLINKVIFLEFAQLKYWLDAWLIVEKAEPIPLDLIDSHHKIADECRRVSWRKRLEGVTVPHPLEQFKLIEAQFDSCSTCIDVGPEHIVYSLHSENLTQIPFQNGGGVSTIRSHGAAPYLGNVVSEGVIGIDLNCVNPNTAWNDVRRIVIIDKWALKDDVNFHRLACDIVRSRTDINEEILDRAAGNPSRLSYNHRAALMSVARSSAPCCTTNTFSRIYISSNRMGVYSHGNQNYHMTFGPAFIFHQTLLSWRMVAHPENYVEENTLRQVFHAHVRRADVPIVYDGSLRLEVYDGIKLVKSPYLLFASKDRMVFKDVAGNFRDEMWARPETADIEDCKLLYGHQLIANSLVSEIVSHEIIGFEGRSTYPSRHGIVSIGDISVIGVEGLIKTIATSVLLLLPYRILCSESPVSFRTATLAFLNKLSSSFWSVFTTPISNSKHLKRVVKRQSAITLLLGTKSNEVEYPLKEGVSKKVCELWQLLNSDIILGTNRAKIIISAPSVSAAKALLSRYLEVCFCGMRFYTRVQMSVMVQHARDLVANMHVADDGNLSTAFMLCCYQFHTTAKELTGGINCRVPPVRLFSLRESWVDRLREVVSTVTDDDGVSSYVIPTPRLPNINRRKSVDFEVPEEAILVSRHGCSCVLVSCKASYHTERYFMPRGFIDKFCYPCLEMINYYSLDVAGVIVLGSKSGVESVCLSYLPECQSIYIHHDTRLTEFSSHQAASFTPPAFLLEGCVDKLISSDRAVVGTTDLSQIVACHHIIEHVIDKWMTGIVAVGPISILKSAHRYSADFCNIAYLAANLDTVKWLLMRVEAQCHHTLQTAVTHLGFVFSQISVVSSAYSCERDTLFYLVCQSKRSRSHLFSASPVVRPQILLSVAENTALASLVQDQLQSCIPSCFSNPHSYMRGLMRNVQGIGIGFWYACSAYIPGWGGDPGDEIPGVHPMTLALSEIHDSILREVTDMLKASERFAQGAPLVKSAVLQLGGGGGIPAELRDAGQRWFNVSLLLSLLRQNSNNLLEVCEVVDQALSRSHTFQAGVHLVTVEINQEEFLDSYSGHLFEILGHLRQFAPYAVHQQAERVYHKSAPGISYFSTDIVSLLQVDFVSWVSVPRMFWVWEFRAFLLGLIKVGVKEGDSEKFGLTSPYNHLINHSARTILGLNFLSSTSHIHHQRQIVLVSTTADIPDVVQGSWLIVDQVRMPQVLFKYSIDYAMFLPWSGIVPRLILVRVRGPQINLPPDLFPAASQMPNRTCRTGAQLMGCSCWCCATEVSICHEAKISTHALESVAVTGPEGSIISKKKRKKNRQPQFDKP